MSKEKGSMYIIFGPPGSGKTVQANYLAKQLKLDHISWGNIYRDKYYYKKYPCLKIIKNEKTSEKLRSEKIAYIMGHEIGELKLADSKKSLIIDGFPRRIEEARLLLKIIKKYGYRIKALININPSLDTAYNRCQSRLLCPKCKKYYDDLVPPKKNNRCDDDDTKLVGFKINKNEVEKDFFSYLKESAPVIAYLRPYAESSFNISGDDDEIIMFSNILLKLKNKVRGDYKFYQKQTNSYLETRYGKFKMITYQSCIDYNCHLALIKGNVMNENGVVVRVHSSCITGDIFGSYKCDCGDQLIESMKIINKIGKGVIIYLFQEGRGINIINKIRAYKLQSEGLDTVEANEILGFPAEMRDYTPAKNILEDLKIKSVILLTNNPDKVNKLTELGIVIQEVRPIEIEPNIHNKKYLMTKKHKMAHRLSKYHK